jgi:DNA repair exonuclease SbcCD ATPase subunit
MKQHVLRKEIMQKLNDVNEKIVELKNISPKELETNKNLQEVLQQLESIRRKIKVQYQTIENLEHAESMNISDLQKNLAKSFDSFEIAYANSVSLMKQRKFSTRKRSVDFNNPLGNK